MHDKVIKIYPIKIENKEEWIKRFQEKVKEYIPNEDYRTEEYLQKYAQKKEYSINILKGKYVKEDDTIILVSIQSKSFFFNTGMIYHGKFIQNEDVTYLEGEAEPIYTSYIKKMLKSPAPIISLGGAVYGMFCNKEILYTIIVIWVFFFVCSKIDERITIKDEKKCLIRNIEDM